MEQEYGPEKTKALTKYMGVVSLTKPQAREILIAVFPEAPESEIARAVMLCATYQLNPLMKHVFLIPFSKGTPKETWATVIGIKAKRLLSSRRGSYSYVDDTPRVMTEQEQKITFGEVDDSKLWVVTKVRDPLTGAEAVGYGFWPKESQPHGTDKGNSKFNMAAIRSESQALDRLRPGEMPEGIEVVPEEFIEGDYKVVDKATGEITEPTIPAPKPKEHWCAEHNCPFEKKTRGSSTWYAHKLPDGSWCNEGKQQVIATKSEPIYSPVTTDIPDAAAEQAFAPPDEPRQPARDPDTLKTLNDLYKACNEDFKLQPAQVISELGVSSQTDISDSPADCYRKIAKVREQQ